MKRTDIHKPSSIIPAEYEYVFSYNMHTTCDGWPIPSFRINCELDRRIVDKDGKLIKNGEHDPDGKCCVIGLRHIAKVKFAKTGNAGKCSVCGSDHIYGDVWKHIPTGEHIFVGHICADKYELIADRSQYELELGKLKAATAAACLKSRKDETVKAYCEKNPGLAEAFELMDKNNIISDIYYKLRKYEYISDKQIALVLKIAHEILHPESKPIEERKIQAPITGERQTVEGEIISIKSHHSLYGSCFKMTVKIVVPGQGYWLTWGTIPDKYVQKLDKGMKVKFKAKFEHGNNEYFTFFKRPTIEKVE